MFLQLLNYDFRILGSHDMSRAREMVSLNVVSSVGQCLHSDYEELLKSSAKFLATFSGMICTYEMATQIQVLSSFIFRCKL